MVPRRLRREKENPDEPTRKRFPIYDDAARDAPFDGAVTPPGIRYTKAADGTHLAYQVEGDGPIDVLWIFAGNIPLESTLEEPRIVRFRERLSSFARLICHDRRGIGLSDPVRSWDDTTLEVRSSDAMSVLDACDSTRTAIVATDYSAGDIAAMVAASNPGRISTLVLNNPAARKLAAPDYAWGVTGEWVDTWVAEFRRAYESGGSDAFAMMTGFDNADQPALDWWARSVRRGARLGQIDSGLRMVIGTDTRALLPLIRAPTLVVHGPNSNSWRSADHATYVADHLPSAQRVRLEGTHTYVYVSPVADAFLDLAEEFTTGERPPSNRIDNRVLATVLFTDIVKSTERLAEVGDQAWADLLAQHNQTVGRCISDFRGRLVGSAGDGVLAMFDGPARAVRCAAAIGDGVRPLGLEVRAGVHTGEVEVAGDDVGGMAVHIGARVCALAGPGEVLVSRTVTDLVVGSGLRFSVRGEHALKGVPGQWEIFELSEPSEVGAI